VDHDDALIAIDGHVVGYVVGDVAFEIETDEASLAVRLRSCLRDLEAPDRPASARTASSKCTFRVTCNRAPDDGSWAVWRDGELCESWLSDDYVATYVVWEISRLVRERATGALVVHASTVGLGDRAIVLAGSSLAGKSTFVTWLTMRGWKFVADDVSVIDAAGLVQPFWRPIGLRAGGPIGDLLADGHDRQYHLVAASTLGELGGPSPVVAVVIVHRSAIDPGPVRLGRAAGACALARHLPLLPQRGAPEFDRLGALVRAVPVISLDIADLEAAEHALGTLATATLR
jgi:hypothetical protein